MKGWSQPYTSTPQAGTHHDHREIKIALITIELSSGGTKKIGPAVAPGGHGSKRRKGAP